MAEASTPEAPTQSAVSKTAMYWLAILLVIMGLLNSIPGVPGIDEAARNLTGIEWFKVRKFPSEWFFPLDVHFRFFSFGALWGVLIRHLVEEKTGTNGKVSRGSHCFFSLLDPRPSFISDAHFSAPFTVNGTAH